MSGARVISSHGPFRCAAWLADRVAGCLARCLSIGFAVLVSTSPVLAQGRAANSLLDDILARGVLRVGTTGDYRPFTYLDKDKGAYEGLDIDLADNLGKALGVKVEFVPTSWPTMMKDFEDGKFDLAAGGVSVTLDRAKKGYFSIPMMREGKTPIVRCADQDKYQTLADIDKPGVRVIANPGGTNERFDRANLKNAQITIHNDNVTIFKEVLAGHADVMLTDASETLYQQKLNPGLCSVHPDKPFDFGEKAFWLQRDMALKAFVDQWLHLQMENGAYRTVFSKWLN